MSKKASEIENLLLDDSYRKSYGKIIWISKENGTVKLQGKRGDVDFSGPFWPLDWQKYLGVEVVIFSKIGAKTEIFPRSMLPVRKPRQERGFLSKAVIQRWNAFFCNRKEGEAVNIIVVMREFRLDRSLLELIAFRLSLNVDIGKVSELEYRHFRRIYRFMIEGEGQTFLVERGWKIKKRIYRPKFLAVRVKGVRVARPKPRLKFFPQGGGNRWRRK